MTEFEGAASGVGGGIGGIGGTAGRVLGGIAGGLKKAHMAIDMRVIDTRTSRIVAATSVEGEATDFALGGALAGAGGGGALGGALGRLVEDADREGAPALPPGGREVHRVEDARRRTTTTARAASRSRRRRRRRPRLRRPQRRPRPRWRRPRRQTPPATPSALKVIQTIKADQDKALLVDLNEAKVRGATLSVVVTLRHTGSKPSAWVLLNDKKSGVMSYDTGETAETIKLDDLVNSALKPGEVRTVRAVFKVPKGAKKVAITLGGVGTFDDVELQ